MAYKKLTWVDDDGSLTVGTLFSAANMNNIEAGVSGLIELLEKSGMGVVVHGATKTTARPTGFDIVVWIGTAEPEHAGENDLWINPEDFGVNSSQFIPTVRVHKAAGQKLLASPTENVLLFDTEEYDNAGIHSTSTNTSRLTAPKEGVYLVGAFLRASAGTSTWLNFELKINGTKRIVMVRNTPANTRYDLVAESAIQLAAGDYVEVIASSSAEITVTEEQAFWMVFVGTGTPSLEPVDWGIVTELPSAAGVGDTCKLKVRESEAMPWKIWDCVKIESSGERPWAASGPPLVAQKKGEGTEDSATTLETAQSSGAPAITLPSVKLEADVRFGANFANANATGVQAAAYLAIAGVTSLVRDRWTDLTNPKSEGQNARGPLAGRYRGSFTPGQQVATYYSRRGLAGTSEFYGLYIEVSPVRVG